MTDYYSLASKFFRGFRWSVIGSILFESSHIIHNMLLFCVLGSTRYGLLGSLFSIVYLVINLADLGFENSFVTYLHIITKSKSAFKKIVLWYVLPQIALLSAGSCIALYVYKTLFYHPTQRLPFFLFATVMVLEGIRIFFRRFLHNVFYTKSTILIEHVGMALYYLAIWIPVLAGVPLTISIVLIPFFCNSVIVTGCFTYMVYTFYKTLPEKQTTLPKNLAYRILKNRYFNGLINVETFVISGNFLVPFFATTFGLKQAGLFKVASIIAHSIRALVKAMIHFPGGAFLVGLKEKSWHAKRAAFYTLSHSLNSMMLCIVLTLLSAYNVLTMFYTTHAAVTSAWVYAFIFVGITILHQLFVVYEQFYLIEELANKLFFIKSIEFILFYVLVVANTFITPVATLVYIGLIQLLCFALLATHAFSRWKVKPYFKVKCTSLHYGLIIIFALSLAAKVAQKLFFTI